MKYILICLLIVLVGCVKINNDYSICLDELADEMCKGRNYSFGESSRALAGNVGDFPLINCYEDERDFNYDTFKFLDFEVIGCKK